MFKIPEEYRAWCNLCNVGFKTLKDLQKHNEESVNKHQIMMQRREDVKETPKES